MVTDFKCLFSIVGGITYKNLVGYKEISDEANICVLNNSG